MTVRVQEADFDLNAELTALRAGDARIGALASFAGVKITLQQQYALLSAMGLDVRSE